jgi:hypothetical protein
MTRMNEIMLYQRTIINCHKTTLRRTYHKLVLQLAYKKKIDTIVSSRSSGFSEPHENIP